MISSLLTLGARYVPSILRTIGSGVGKLIGKSSHIKTLGSKIKANPILNAGLGALKEIGENTLKRLEEPPITNNADVNNQTNEKEMELKEIENDNESLAIHESPKRRKFIKKLNNNGIRRRKYLKNK